MELFTDMKLSPKYWIPLPPNCDGYTAYLDSKLHLRTEKGGCWTTAITSAPQDISHPRHIPTRSALWLAHCRTPVPLEHTIVTESDVFRAGTECVVGCVNPHHMRTPATELYRYLLRRLNQVSRIELTKKLRYMAQITAHWALLDSRSDRVRRHPRPYFARDLEMFDKYTEARRAGMSLEEGRHTFLSLAPIRPMEVSLHWYTTRYLQVESTMLLEQLGLSSSDSKTSLVRQFLLNGGVVYHDPIRPMHLLGSHLHIPHVGAYELNIEQMRTMPPYIPAQFVNGRVFPKKFTPWYWRPVQRISHRIHTYRNIRV